MRPVYVTGHRNPDTDSIASAIGYAELRSRLDRDDEYVPVRLGDANAQTRWVLEQAGVPEPRYLPHIMLRVRDVMEEEFERADVDESVRAVGLTMAQRGLDLLPIVDDDGSLAGVMTERVLARRYIRESREASTPRRRARDDRRDRRGARGRARRRRATTRSPAACGSTRWTSGWEDTGIAEGDVVVVGNREDAPAPGHRARRRAARVSATARRPSDEIVELARGARAPRSSSRRSTATSPGA